VYFTDQFTPSLLNKIISFYQKQSYWPQTFELYCTKEDIWAWFNCFYLYTDVFNIIRLHWRSLYGRRKKTQAFFLLLCPREIKIKYSCHQECFTQIHLWWLF